MSNTVCVCCVQCRGEMVQGWSEATLTGAPAQSGRYSAWSNEEGVSDEYFIIPFCILGTVVEVGINPLFMPINVLNEFPDLCFNTCFLFDFECRSMTGRPRRW